eukprot:PhM_4_TR3649/c0_g1_i1/m.80348
MGRERRKCRIRKNKLCKDNIGLTFLDHLLSYCERHQLVRQLNCHHVGRDVFVVAVQALIDAAVEVGVDLHDVHRAQQVRLGQRLAQVPHLAIGEPALGLRAGAGREHRVDGVDIEGEVDRAVVVGVDAGQRHLHHLTDAVLVDVVHGVHLDAAAAHHGGLRGIDIAQGNEAEAMLRDVLLEPLKPGQLPLEPAQHMCGGHAVVVARRRRLGRVAVTVGIDPHDAELLACFQHTGNGARGDGVVATDGQHEGTSTGRLIGRVVHTLKGTTDNIAVVYFGLGVAVGLPTALDLRHDLLQGEVAHVLELPARSLDDSVEPAVAHCLGHAVHAAETLALAHRGTEHDDSLLRRQEVVREFSFLQPEVLRGSVVRQSRREALHRLLRCAEDH